MSDQTREKEKDLAELMIRIFKEPLSPLSESVKNLERELFDIKAEIEIVSGTVADCQTHSKNAAKRSKDASELLDTLRNEQSEWVINLQASLAKNSDISAQTIDAHLGESLKAVAQSERRVLDALSRVCEAQISATHILSAMKVATEHSQTLMTENLQAEHALRESLINGQTEIIGALKNHVGALNSQFDQNQAKLKQLTITTGVLFTSVLFYVGYELLHRFN